MRKYLFILLIPLLVGFTAPQTITVSMPSDTNKYYVDFQASNGVGTEVSPWNNMTSANSGVNGQARPLYVYIKGTSPDLGEFFWSEAGTSGNEVVLTAWGEDSAIIIAEFRINVDYVILDGLSFSSPQLTFKVSPSNTEGVRPNGNNITIWRTEMDSNSTGSAGLYTTGGTGLKVYNCKLHGSTDGHNVYIRGHTNFEFKNNISYGAPGGSGIQINPHDSGYDVVDAVISGNALHDNLYGVTILSGTGSDGELDGLDVYNNLIWDTSSQAIKFTGGANYAGIITGVEVYNNTLYGDVLNQHGDTVDRPATTTFRNNILTGTVTHATDCKFVAESNNLESYAINNFESVTDTDANFLQLKSSATGAIGQGYDTNPPVTVDYFGTSRPASALDIGANEYTGNTNNTTIGSGVPVTIGAAGAPTVSIIN